MSNKSISYKSKPNQEARNLNCLTNIKDEDKQKVLVCLEKMRALIAGESFPAAARERGKCVDCEWLNFCGDILLPEQFVPVNRVF